MLSRRHPIPEEKLEVVSLPGTWASEELCLLSAVASMSSMSGLLGLHLSMPPLGSGLRTCVTICAHWFSRAVL